MISTGHSVFIQAAAHHDHDEQKNVDKRPGDEHEPYDRLNWEDLDSGLVRQEVDKQLLFTPRRTST